ncbi:MAG: hypothetical protein LBU60_01170 [Clostridiales bacterium]|jgi:hypothetical protein|nr:hypothetical protein [Clostridiales bacterium]
MRQFKNFKEPKLDNFTQQSEELQQSLQKYSNMNEEQLLDQLIKNIAMQKANGTFDKQRLMQFVTSVHTYMTPEQISKMQEIVDIMDSNQ